MDRSRRDRPRVRPAVLIAGGLALAAVGFGMFTLIDRASGLATLVAGSVVYSLGLAPVFTLATDMIVGSAPPERAGAASAISETSSEFGGALGIAILGSIGAAIYRRAMAQAVPVGIAPELVEAARGTLGGAVATADQLPGRGGVELLGTARDAFVQALELTAAICAFIVMATAIVTLVLLRRARPGAEAAQPASDPASSRTSPVTGLSALRDAVD